MKHIEITAVLPNVKIRGLFMFNSSLIIRFLSALIIFTLVLTACQNNQVETEHFIYKPAGKQSHPPTALMNDLESEYARITELLNVKTKEKLNIIIFASHEDYIKKTGLPSWSVGGYTSNGLLLSPQYNKVVAVHELTHVLINRINRKTPRWLNEGIATYIAKDLDMSMQELRNEVKLYMIPPFSSYRMEDPTEFMNIKGYHMSCSMIDFIVSEYDWERLHQLIRSPYDFEGVFQMSGEEFWNKWKEYLEKND